MRASNVSQDIKKVLRKDKEDKKIVETKLNLGCYNHILKGYINLDKEQFFEGINVVCNLETFPYPFEDNTFDEILAHCILEHIDANKTKKVMEELYRISKNNAIIKIEVPYGSEWVRDLDHKRGFDYYTFLNMCRKDKRGWMDNGKFELVKMKGIPKTVFGKFIPNFKTPFGYKFGVENFKFGLREILSLFLNFIVRNIYVELRVVK